MKLHAVGLRGAAGLMPAAAIGRHGAARRARARDRDGSRILIYDEPFAGLDPISMGVVMRLVRQLNDALGMTSIVVTHDVHEISRIADTSYMLSDGQVVARGPEARESPAVVRQFIAGTRTGPCRFTTGARLCEQLLGGRGVLSGLAADCRQRASFVQRVGARRCSCASDRADPGGPAALPADRRAGLQRRRAVARDHHDLRLVRRHGAGPAGVRLLQRFGSEDSLGTGAALALLKELGPVVTALLFAGRAGTALASEIGLMRATDQLSAMEMMAVDPMRGSSCRDSSAARSRCRC